MMLRFRGMHARALFGGLAWLFVSATVLADPPKVPPKKALDCKSPATTYDMLECSKLERVAAENQMNAHLTRIKKSGQFDVAALNDAQKQWSTYVQKDCTWQASINAGGTLENVSYAACMADTTRRRAAELAKVITDYKL